MGALFEGDLIFLTPYLSALGGAPNAEPEGQGRAVSGSRDPLL